MKRSQINAAIRELIRTADEQGFKLPPFARWTPEDWKSKDGHHDHIRRTRCGWDVTDYGSGDFGSAGLVLLTMRNGYPGDPDKPDQKTYCEKIMLVGEGQVTPTHMHHRKTEDIINRGGGRLLCKVWKATPDERLSDESFQLLKDGAVIACPPSAQIALDPGDSVTFRPGTYHTFWAEESGGAVLAGEVSSVNDDEQDNRFLERISRFPQIEENEPPAFLLVTDY